MGLEDALDISVSGIDAERQHMELISSNIANINTTRTLNGGAYRRKIAVFGEKELSFDQELKSAEGKIESGGVMVSEIAEDKSPLHKVYNPSHPDADGKGFVNMPNVDLAKEMVDMTESSKLYESNITVFNVTKKMIQDTMQIQ